MLLLRYTESELLISALFDPPLAHDFNLDPVLDPDLVLLRVLPLLAVSSR